MERRRFLGLASLAASAWTSRPLRVLAVQQPRWQRDGAGLIARIGVLTPDFDPVPESEVSAMSPAGVSIHASRVPRDPNQTAAAFAQPPHVDAAAERLRDLAPKAIVFAFTSSSYVLGADADEPVRTRLQQHAGGIPVIMTCPSAVDALRKLGAKRMALVNPPWFTEQVHAKGLEYFHHQGFEVVRSTRLEPLRRLQEEVPPAQVYEWVRANTPREADAVFIGGNGLRAVGAIQALEAALGKPVLTANQVAFWAALRAVNVTASITGYGRIFSIRK